MQVNNVKTAMPAMEKRHKISFHSPILFVAQFDSCCYFKIVQICIEHEYTIIMYHFHHHAPST